MQGLWSVYSTRLSPCNVKPNKLTSTLIQWHCVGIQNARMSACTVTIYSIRIAFIYIGQWYTMPIILRRVRQIYRFRLREIRLWSCANPMNSDCVIHYIMTRIVYDCNLNFFYNLFLCRSYYINEAHSNVLWSIYAVMIHIEPLSI